MTSVKLAGETELQLLGNLVQVGDKLSGLKFTAKDLSEVSIDDFKGPLLLNFFPSIDTDICAFSVKKFNQEAANKLTVINISADLPFAAGRFCAAAGIENSQTLSSFRNRESLEKLGLLIDTLPLKGLAARAVILLDANHIVKYVHLNNEIKADVDFAGAIAAINSL